MNPTSLPDAFVTGFGLCGSLIVAIGAQNAFVLRQGLRRAHVGPVVALCASADALLLALGVWGLGAVTARLPSLASLMAAAGAAFLAVYGGLALRRAAVARPQARGLEAAETAAGSLRAALAVAAGFTFLNPHVYLDTVVLAGSVGARLQPEARAAFVAGGACASVAWFSALGWGAGRLAPVFRSPKAWRMLDAGVGATMLALAAALATQTVRSTVGADPG